MVFCSCRLPAYQQTCSFFRFVWSDCQAAFFPTNNSAWSLPQVRVHYEDVNKLEWWGLWSTCNFFCIFVLLFYFFFSFLQFFISDRKWIPTCQFSSYRSLDLMSSTTPPSIIWSNSDTPHLIQRLSFLSSVSGSYLGTRTVIAVKVWKMKKKN